MTSPTRVAQLTWTTESQLDYLQVAQTQNGGQILGGINYLGQLYGSLAQGGGSELVAAVSLPSQSGTSTGTLYAVPAAKQGIYRVSMDLITTTAGATGSVLTIVSWNNGTTNASLQTGSLLNLASVGELSSQGGTFYSAANQDINYDAAVTGGAGSVYSLYLRLEYLG